MAVRTTTIGRLRGRRPLPPRLKGVPVLGTAPALKRDALAVIDRVAAECGDVGAFRLGPQLAVLVASPSAAYEVLIGHPEDFDKGRVQLRALTPLLGQGLLTSEGELHRKQRSLIAPHFIPRHIAHYVSTMVGLAHRTVAEWEDGAEVELVEQMNALTMEIVFRTLLSTEAREERRLAEAVTAAFEWEMHALTTPLPLPLSVPTPRNVRMRRALAYLRAHVGGVIEARRASGERPDDMLTMLLETRYDDGTPMSAQQIYDETLTLAGAAQETSADALAWTQWLLSQHPDVYDRVREEVDAVLGDRPATAADLKQLPYCLQVFKESMRMYPPAAVLLRGTVRETTIGGYRVPRGTVVLVSPWALHHRTDVYPDPHRFDPDRFERQNERGIPKCGYLPFGAGRRVCLGNHFALMEGQALTATMAQLVEVEAVPGHPVEPELLINVRPRHGIRARVRARAKALAAR